MKKFSLLLTIIIFISCKKDKSSDSLNSSNESCQCKVIETKECSFKNKMYKMAVVRPDKSKDTVWVLESSPTNAKNSCENFCPKKDDECKVGSEVHSEGNDQAEDFNQEFWNNYKKMLTVSKLPTYKTFYGAYPKGPKGGCKDPKEVFKEIGGELLNPKFKNACAARVSLALNKSGIKIPFLKEDDGKKITFKGKDNKYYFVGAKNLFEWLNKEFGKPTFTYKPKAGQTNEVGFKKGVAKRKGIYLMIPRYPGTNYFNASGHSDLYDGSSCNCNCWFDPKGGLHTANFWELSDKKELIQ